MPVRAKANPFTLRAPACLEAAGSLGSPELLQSKNLPTLGAVIRSTGPVMQKGSQKQIVYYWMPQRGRILTNAYQLKLFAFWNALTKQRTDGALVRVITEVNRDENVDQAEARLKEFVRDIVPVIENYIPGQQIEQ